MNIFYNIDYRLHFFILCILYVVLSSCEINKIERKKTEAKVIDSVSEWIQLAKDPKIAKEKRLQFLRKSNDQLLLSKNDSFKVKKLLKIADRYYELDQDSLFLEINNVVYDLAKKMNNTAAIAEYHWNKGNLFSENQVLDSAFHHYNEAHDLYTSLNHEYYRAKMAYNMSFIEFRIRNYVESEILVISAIEGFKKLNKNFNLFLCYNRLLLLDKEVENFEAAFDHYTIAMKFLKKTNKNGIHEEKLLNNLSLVYQKQQKYEEAIDALDKALLNETLQDKHANLYAKLIDNRAYCRFLKGEEKGVLDGFNKALHIRDSLGNKAGVGISNIHLSAYYLKRGDSLKAFQSAKVAHDLAKSLGLNRDILSSLVQLSQADPVQATAYMNSYIQLNDSLLLEERKVRNKFTRIQFETEDYIATNEDLEKQNIWISLTSVFAVVSLSLLFFGYRQKLRNRNLLLERHQQKANEEIYDLMLKKQNREEEGRIQERIRISQDLHDGILSWLVSVRMGFDLLNLRSNPEDKEKFNGLIKEMQLIEKEIRNISHALKTDELSSKKDFSKLLYELLEEQSVMGNFIYELQQDDSIAWHRVDEKIKINLFRTAQEAICNIIKYAKCKKVTVSLERRENEIVLLIVDDGEGFDTNKRQKGIGLKNMRSRAKSIGAMIHIKSAQTEGTSIEVSIPTKTLYHEAVA